MIDMSNLQRFKAPVGCETCPAQCEIGSDYNEAQALKLAGLYAAETMVGERGEELDNIALDVLNGNEEVAQLLTSSIRQGAAKSLDEIDQNIEDLERESNSLARSCDKPLKMAATKNGRQYIVGLCTSASLYQVNNDRPQHTETHVWVKTD